ncbi:G2 and S phase-expressed protein 1 isoform X2 [Oryzias latipes]|uniref:G2 and S phase-expressed protein 1 isoform X2 n=1 Tax=Oryzias latipes TaxID=8090 RepID=UPI0005CBE85B|nr:G2 and S phase-expressed protein 1 isoform X2 [Oryzias latipes]
MWDRTGTYKKKNFRGDQTTMAFEAKSDVLFLQDEKFDFDVSLSPASSKDDEDEVFEGPVEGEESRVSVSKASELLEGDHVFSNWSPLTGERLDAVCQEAHSLVNQLQDGKACGVEDANIAGEQFLQDSEAKKKVLCSSSGALSPIKRQTFCVQDTPTKQLPPAIQLQLPRGSRRSSAAPLSAARSTSSPVGGAKLQPRSNLRAKAPVGVAVVLPSKAVAPPASRLTSRADRTRLQPPIKAVSKRSPSSRLANRAESCEDLLSDAASVASDISDSSINSTLSLTRTLAPPSKRVVGKNHSGGKAPTIPGRKVTDRKNTSSSSSSVSSFNSSLSLSPAKGKLNSSVNQSFSSSARNAPSGVNRSTNDRRPRRSTVYAATEQQSTKTLHQARKISECPKKSTPLKRAESVTFQPTPSKRLLEKTASMPSSVSSLLPGRLKSKPEALVFPTPGVRHTDASSDISKGLKPKRLVSFGSMNSVPIKPSAAHLMPSESVPKSVQGKARRPSGLPTPVRSRSFAFSNSLTPRVKPSVVTDSCTAPTPSSALKHLSSSRLPRDAPLEEHVDPPDIPPFRLEEEEAPVTTSCESSEPHPPENKEDVEPTTPTLPKNLIEMETAEENTGKTQEVLLLDLPAPAPNPTEKLLIDLTNTPDLIRKSTKSCTETQLIDLSSPLIKWSPDSKHENNAPLINLSF